jgi:hypothetical protein
MSDVQALATPDAPLPLSVAAGRCTHLAAGGTHFLGEILALLRLVDKFHCFSILSVFW